MSENDKMNINIYRAFNTEVDKDTVIAWKQRITNLIEGTSTSDSYEKLIEDIKNVIPNGKSCCDTNRSGEYVQIGMGATVCCYKRITTIDGTPKPAIIKEFSPCYGADRFNIFVDDAEKFKGFEKNILQDFLRFLTQDELIGEIVKDQYNGKINSFPDPQLYLSSIGLIYLDTAFCGKILSEYINKQFEYAPKKLDDVIDRFELVKRIAQSVKAYHRNNWFNGDLKPNNLYQIENDGSPLAIVNIDFGTCVKVDKIDSKYFKEAVRTTPMFYCVEEIKSLAELDLKEAKQMLLKMDVAALTNILIYVLLDEPSRNDIIDYHKDLFEGGFDGNGSKNLFALLEAESSLARLAIYKEISALIKNLCEPLEKKYNIEQFLEQLEIILAMLKCCDNSAAVVQRENKRTFENYLGETDNEKQNTEAQNTDSLSAKILWFANLHQLDKTFGNQLNKIIESHNIKVEDTDVKQIINKLVYEN